MEYKSEHYRIIKTRIKDKSHYELRAKDGDYVIFSWTTKDLNEGLKQAKVYANWLESVRNVFVSRARENLKLHGVKIDE